MVVAICDFCGMNDATFAEDDENLDLHYWKDCPMLLSCPLCEQVIEVSTFHQHIANECESGIKYQICNQCTLPFPEEELKNHQNNGECKGPVEGDKTRRCPFCCIGISAGEASWKKHLLENGGCPKNPRPLPALFKKANDTIQCGPTTSQIEDK